MLSVLPKITDPNVLVGTSTSDDAAVYRISDELAIIQTVDFFTPVADSAYDFGAIAAANSLSDVYAMGGRPVLAMNIVGFPKNNPDCPISELGDILRGGADKATEAGVSIIGGHTVDDQEPKYGLSVTGFVHPEQFWRNVGGKPGDKLIATKALGMGIISTALRDGVLDENFERRAIAAMAKLNKDAATIGQRFAVHACTDITGFGFLGHLREMVGDLVCGARINASAMAIQDGTRSLAEAGHIPGGARSNRKFLENVVRFDADVDEIEQLILCDPQTSGGLLFAVSAEDAEPLLSELKESGVVAALVGELVDEFHGRIQVDR